MMFARKRLEVAAGRIAPRACIHSYKKESESEKNGRSQGGVWFGLLTAGVVLSNFVGGFGGE